MRFFAILIISGLLLVSCERKDCGCVPPPGSACTLKAIVAETDNLDCHKPLLVFEDTAALRQITGISSDRFVANFLPPDLNVLNKQLWVCVTKLVAQEEFACTTMGLAYPHIKVLYARERN